MKTFPLTVYPETDGELCGRGCKLKCDTEDGQVMWCTAFDDEVELASRDGASPLGSNWFRYRRHAECIAAERDLAPIVE